MTALWSGAAPGSVRDRRLECVVDADEAGLWCEARARAGRAMGERWRRGAGRGAWETGGVRGGAAAEIGGAAGGGAECEV